MFLQESDDSSYEDEDEDADEANKLLDDVDDSTKLLGDVDDSSMPLVDIDDSKKPSGEKDDSVRILIDICDDTDEVDTAEHPKLHISESDLSKEPYTAPQIEVNDASEIDKLLDDIDEQKKNDNTHLTVPWAVGDGKKETSEPGAKKPGLFYIGEDMLKSLLSKW